MPPAVEVWSLNHWTAREVPTIDFLNGPVRHKILLFWFAAKILNYSASHKTTRIAASV